MIIESIKGQYDRALEIEIKPDQLETEQRRIQLFALAKYNAPRMRLGLPEIRVIDEILEESPEFQLLLKTEKSLAIFDRIKACKFRRCY